ncbi:hypothetical protein CC2G_013362 [Coprinopsis cinerea AmutBmut pab1-1]|nr:hypothetical protein CC2G_013362 [Coprinopsis cinerea AmutBmut pab1-1]
MCRSPQPRPEVQVGKSRHHDAQKFANAYLIYVQAATETIENKNATRAGLEGPTASLTFLPFGSYNAAKAIANKQPTSQFVANSTIRRPDHRFTVTFGNQR